MVPYPVIAGPTAGGKSGLACGVFEALSERGMRAEIVSADSIQVYRGLDIGSAKPSREERERVPHHLLDVADPTERFSVADWLARADRAVAEIQAGGGVPIVVGGTHLYIKAFLEGLFEGPDPDPAVRQVLGAMSQAERRAELSRVDPAAAERIHANDERRTIRALEVYRQTGTPISEWQRQWDTAVVREGVVLIGIEWPTAELNRRINARVLMMVREGLVEEARALWEGRRFGPTAREALGYKQLIDHFEGRCSLDDAIERIKIETRRFAKNQRTWLRRLRMTPGSVWIDAGSTPEPTWPGIVMQALDRARA